MTTRTVSPRLLRWARSTLLCSGLILGCEGPVDSSRTGSESHFIECERDADCPEGTCESGYCELNGRRLVQGENAEVHPEPEPSEPESNGVPPTGASGPDASSSGASGSQSSGSGGAATENSGGNSPGGNNQGRAGAETGGETAAPGAGAGGREGTGGDGAPISGAVPLAFRIVNESSEGIYLDGSHPVRCGAIGPEASCWYATTDICMADCAAIEPGSQCAIQCEQPIPSVMRLEPGQQEVVPWDGRFVARNEGHCSDGDCYDASPIDDGTHVARVSAFAEVACEFEPCIEIADGITQGYRTAGSYRHAEVEFAIPSSEDEILLVITDALLSCPPAPAACCGDGFLDEREACDDGNRTDGDACNAACGEGGGGGAGTGGNVGFGGNVGLAGAGNAVVTCGETTCGAGEYCRAACSGDGSPSPGLPSCTPLPVGCENDATCECICNGLTDFCTPDEEGIQCGCP